HLLPPFPTRRSSDLKSGGPGAIRARRFVVLGSSKGPTQEPLRGSHAGTYCAVTFRAVHLQEAAMALFGTVHLVGLPPGPALPGAAALPAELATSETGRGPGSAHVRG